MSTDMVTAKMLDTAEALTPDDIAAYLKINGWTDAGPYGPLARLYRLQIDNQLYEAVIPNAKDTGDFRWRVIDLLHTLARASGKGLHEVCQEISSQKEKRNLAERVIADENIVYGSLEKLKDKQNNTEARASTALAIKSCLESLMNDATRCDMDDLARFISLAVLAAEEEALANPDLASRYNKIQEILSRTSNFRKH